MAGAILLWAAFPPLGWWPLAWVAPTCWIVLAALPKRPPGRFYRAIYLAGFVHWMLLLQGVRLAHWATYFGWVALAAYLACYLPLFVGLTRVAVHRIRLPLFLAAPIIWTGLELARSYFASGFSVALLAHTQVSLPVVIQLADLAGGYGLSFLIVMTATIPCYFMKLPETSPPKMAQLAAVVGGLTALAAMLAYGYSRLDEEQVATGPVVKVGLVQRSVETIFEYDRERNAKSLRKYIEESRLVLRESPDVQLLVWPESMLNIEPPLITHDDVIKPPPGVELPPDIATQLDAAALTFQAKTSQLAAALDFRAPLVAGTGALHYGAEGVLSYNAAVYLNESGDLIGRYNKMHPVMFGEYVPFAGYFPWLYRLMPFASGLTPGETPQVFQVGDLRAAPSVCFESTVPHLLRRQVVELDALGESPDFLLNITNDGWFRGSSILDLHLACAVFRAVELRRPMLVAANTGLSAWIDNNGGIVKQTPRMQAAHLVAELRRNPRESVYLHYGDLPAACCLAFCFLVGAVGVFPLAFRGKRGRALKTKRAEADSICSTPTNR